MNDSEVLFLIALEEYIKRSGDKNFLVSISKILEEIIEFLDERTKNDLLLNKESFTWMDTLDRTGIPIELEAMYAKSLSSIAFLQKLLNKEYEKYYQKAKKVENILLKFAEKSIDRITLEGKIERKRRINFIFLPYYRISSLTFIENILKDLEVEYGLTTLSINDKNFDPTKYHEGSSWIWLNLIYAQLLLRNGNFRKAYSIIEKTNSLLNKYSLLSFPECIHPFNGKNLGALKQAWSAAMAIEVIDKGLIGFEFNALNNTINLSPFLQEGMKIERKIVLTNDTIKFEIERKNSKYYFTFESRKRKKYRLHFSPLF